GAVTVVTLTDETGAFLIDYEKDKYHFIFRDVDRMRYCGMAGKINRRLAGVDSPKKETCRVQRRVTAPPGHGRTRKKGELTRRRAAREHVHGRFHPHRSALRRHRREGSRGLSRPIPAGRIRRGRMPGAAGPPGGQRLYPRIGRGRGRRRAARRWRN